MLNLLFKENFFAWDKNINQGKLGKYLINLFLSLRPLGTNYIVALFL